MNAGRFPKDASFRDVVQLLKKLLACLGGHEASEIFRAKEGPERIQALIQSLQACSRPAMTQMRVDSVSWGRAESLLRLIGEYLDQRQVVRILRASDFRATLIDELARNTRGAPPIWLNSNEMLRRALQFLRKYGDGEELATASGISSAFSDFESFFLQPIPEAYDYQPNRITFPGVFLPDKGGVDGYFRTLRAYWDYLEFPSSLANKSCRKRIVLDRDPSYRSIVKFGQGGYHNWRAGDAEYQSGVRWVTLDCNEYTHSPHANFAFVDGKYAMLEVLMLAALCPEWMNHWRMGDRRAKAPTMIDPWHDRMPGASSNYLYLQLVTGAGANEDEYILRLSDFPYNHDPIDVDV